VKKWKVVLIVVVRSGASTGRPKTYQGDKNEDEVNLYRPRDIITKFFRASSYGKKGGHVGKWMYRGARVVI